MCLLHEGAADKSRAGGRRWRREEKYHHLGKGAKGLVRHGAVGRARVAVTLSDTQHAALLSRVVSRGPQEESATGGALLKPLSERGHQDGNKRQQLRLLSLRSISGEGPDQWEEWAAASGAAQKGRNSIVVPLLSLLSLLFHHYLRSVMLPWVSQVPAFRVGEQSAVPGE